ncbi:MAG UNVERIFIED_CONTAM: sigma-70 family RNA polymerase sigma factor [Planctomycetaceae bacterium]
MLVDEYRRLHRGRRDIAREQQEIAASIDSSAAGLEAWLIADQTSPSHAAARNEQLLRLADAMLELPQDQREAVVLKYLQGQDLLQIAVTTGKTVASIAGLLRRALSRLRQLLPRTKPEQEDHSDRTPTRASVHSKPSNTFGRTC